MRSRSAANDALLSIAGVGALMAILVGLDDRVRDHFTQLVNGGPSRELVTAGSWMRGLATVLADALRTQSFEHAPLMIFALVAMVLVLFMTRV